MAKISTIKTFKSLAIMLDETTLQVTLTAEGYPSTFIAILRSPSGLFVAEKHGKTMDESIANIVEWFDTNRPIYYNVPSPEQLMRRAKEAAHARAPDLGKMSDH